MNARLILRYAVLSAALALGFSNATHAAVATAATVSATAQYQSDSSGLKVLHHGDPGAAITNASAGPGDSAGTVNPGVDVFDGAIARARSEINTSLATSSVGVYSHAGGYSPGFASPPSNVRANSLVHWSRWSERERAVGERLHQSDAKRLVGGLRRGALSRDLY